MWPITRVWHVADVIMGIAGVKERRSILSVGRLTFALIGLAGNVIIEREQLHSNVITIGGIRWKRLD